jgi:hypothetical protein
MLPNTRAHEKYNKVIDVTKFRVAKARRRTESFVRMGSEQPSRCLDRRRSATRIARRSRHDRDFESTNNRVAMTTPTGPGMKAPG